MLDLASDLADFASAHGLSLSEERAGRAVAAGQGTLLRERLEEAASTVVPDRGRGDPVG